VPRASIARLFGVGRGVGLVGEVGSVSGVFLAGGQDGAFLVGERSVLA
jgi:hypothetical protein